MPRALVAVVCLLALGLPVLAQGEADADLAKRIEELIEQLDDFGGRADDAIGSLNRVGSPAVPALTVALSDESWCVRFNAARALGLIGPNAAPAVPALIVALSDEESSAVRFFSAGGAMTWSGCPRSSDGEPTP